MSAAAPPEGVMRCPRCSIRVVVVHDPPAVIETSRAPAKGDPVYFEHTSGRCRAARADQRRKRRHDLDDHSLCIVGRCKALPVPSPGDKSGDRSGDPGRDGPGQDGP